MSKAIKIEGIELTPQAIQRIIMLQQEDNFSLECEEKALVDLICFLIRNRESFAEGDDKVDGFLLTLASVRDSLIDLKK